MVVRAIAVNTKTGAFLNEIPFRTLSVTNKLNAPGSWSMEMPVTFTSPNGTEILTTENFDVNFTSVVILRDALPIMYGLVDTEDGEINEDEATVNVGGPDLALGYLQRRLFLTQLTIDDDQFDIASEIVQEAGPPFGPVVDLDKLPSSTTGQHRQRSYYPGNRKYCYELLSELAAVERGFDFCSHVVGSQELGFAAGITLGYPRLERVTGFALVLGKNISRLRYTKDGKKYANVVQVGGADKGDYSVPVTAANAADLATYARFDRTESRPTVTNTATLLDHATRYLRLTSPQGVVEYQFVVNTDDPDCQVGSFRAGDQFQVRAKKGRVDLDTLMRVSEWTLDVNENGEETLTMSMVQTGLLS